VHRGVRRSCLVYELGAHPRIHRVRYLPHHLGSIRSLVGGTTAWVILAKTFRLCSPWWREGDVTPVTAKHSAPRDLTYGVNFQTTPKPYPPNTVVPYKFPLASNTT